MCNMLLTTDLCNGRRHFWRRVRLCEAASDCRQVLVAEPLIQMHICCSLAMITRVQCGRLLKLDVEALHELHYQMITLGKVIIIRIPDDHTREGDRLLATPAHLHNTQPSLRHHTGRTADPNTKAGT